MNPRALNAWILLLLLVGADASAYTGGPIRAEMVRYDESEARIYFRLQAYDESSPLPEMYYLDLEGPRPRRPIRAPWLEPTETSYGKRQSKVEAVCEPLVRVRGLFEIPGRPERVVLVSYIGRREICEEIDTLVLIPD